MSSTSTFNADQFLQTTLDQANETVMQIPDAKEYDRLQCIKVTPRQFVGGQDQRLFTVIDIEWEVLDEEQRKKTELEHPVARQTIFLDVSPTGALEFGKNKNVQLGRLREACGQNRSGRKWSMAGLIGAVVSGVVTHSTDRNGIQRAEVARVAAPGGSADSKKAA